MKQLLKKIALFVAVAAFGLTVNAQSYNGKIKVKKATYIYKTNCNETVGSDKAKIKTEYYGLSIAKKKKNKKKTALKTPCKSLIVRSNPGSVKGGLYRITFSSKDKQGKLMSGVEGTKKKVRYDFEFKNGSVKTKDGKWSKNAKDLNAALTEIVGYLAKNMKL